MSIHSEQALIGWVVATLTGGGLTVGDGVAPSAVPSGAGCVVVYSIAGGETSGTLDAPRSDAEPIFQVTSVSSDPAQVRWLVDRVRVLLDAAVPAVLSDGRSVLWLDFPISSTGAIRDDDVQPPKWFAPDRFAVGTSS